MRYKSTADERSGESCMMRKLYKETKKFVFLLFLEKHMKCDETEFERCRRK